MNIQIAKYTNKQIKTIPDLTIGLFEYWFITIERS